MAEQSQDSGPKLPLASQRRITRGELRGELAQLSRHRRRPPSRGVLSGGRHLERQLGIRAIRGPRQVSHALLDVSRCRRERAVHLPAHLEWGALVDHRREQGMRKVEPAVAQVPDAGINRLAQRRDNLRVISVRARNHVDRRTPRQRRDKEHISGRC
jgi:hypothetical protein